MVEKQKHLKQLEDAFFMLAMDEVALEEGREAIALNEQLKEESEATVPEQLQPYRCQREDTSNCKPKRCCLRKRIHVMSIIVLFLLAIFVLTCAGFPEVRTATFNMILNTVENDTVDHAIQDTLPSVDLTWIPDGFTLVQQERLEDREFYYYTSEENAVLCVEVMIAVDHILHMDTENAETESMIIQGSEATLIKKDIENQMIWLDQDFSVVVIVSGESIDVESLIKVAENIELC